MERLINAKDFNLEKFARSLEKDCQEGVKWEIRKLQWIREERAKEQPESKAA